jgi:ABC-type antimicrobial peptide transport system permease subunit
MKSTAFITILSRQIKQKLGRFFLASGGIAVGVWAITLTTGLSQGASTTLITAINTQPEARNVSLSRQATAKKANVFDFNASYDLVAFNDADVLQLQKNNPHITSFTPNGEVGFAVVKPGKTFDCTKDGNYKPIVAATKTSQETDAEKKLFEENCISFSSSLTNPDLFISGNKAKIVGNITTLKEDEVIACFSCNKGALKTALGASEPKDLLGKQIEMSLTDAPRLFERGKKVSLSNADNRGSNPFLSIIAETKIEGANTKTMKIVGVYDDRDAGFFGAFTSNFVIPKQEANRAFMLANPTKSIDNFGSIGYTVTLDSVQNVKSFVLAMDGGEFIAVSAFLGIVEGITIFFNALTVIFAIFGLIAVVASLFGIINVMFISVLERQKEIGILKALGATNSAIFWLFFIESAFLGVFGWLVGTLLALAGGYGIAGIANMLIKGNAGASQTLASFGIDHVYPLFPWWLLLATFVLSLLSTTISGLIPSLRAARQNPAEVMRSE